MWIDEKTPEKNHYNINYETPDYTHEDYLGVYALSTLVSESDQNAPFIASMGLGTSKYKLNHQNSRLMYTVIGPI